MKARTTIGLLKLLAALPPRSADFLMAGVGRLLYGSNARSKRTTLANLSLVYPELAATAREELARDSLIDLCRKAPAMARAWLGSGKDRIDDQRVGGDVRATVENGTGLLLLIPHLGHWELLGHWVSQLGPLHALYQPPKAEGLDALVLNGRRGAGFQVHPTTVRGVSALSKALKNGEIVAVLPDQHPDPEGSVKAPFFNHAIPTMTLAAKLIQKNPQAHVLTLAALRRFPGAYEVVLDRPNEEFRNSDLVTACTEMNQSIERLIAQAPEQYQWEYKRFRGLPAGVQPY